MKCSGMIVPIYLTLPHRAGVLRSDYEDIYIYSLKFIVLSKHILVIFLVQVHSRYWKNQMHSRWWEIRCIHEQSGCTNRSTTENNILLSLVKLKMFFRLFTYLQRWYKQIIGSDSGMDTLLKWIHMKKLSPLCGAYFNT